MGKYKLKKTTYINWIIILIFLLSALICVNIGYSLWSSKLNIFGKVDLELNTPHLDVVIPQISTGKYINLNSSDFVFVKDEYVENSLTTVVRVKDSNIENTIGNKELSINFAMKNLSKNDGMYTDGSLILLDYSRSNDMSSFSANLSKGTIESGSLDNFNFYANIDSELLDKSIYYKYEIVYKVDGVKKNFYYTISILPAE